MDTALDSRGCVLNLYAMLLSFFSEAPSSTWEQPSTSSGPKSSEFFKTHFTFLVSNCLIVPLYSLGHAFSFLTVTLLLSSSY